MKRTVSFVAMARQTVAAWVDDYAPSMGAALAYYTLFSLAPLLLIAVSIAGLVFGPDAARGEIFGELHDVIGDQGAAAVQALLQSLNRPAQGVVGTMVGLGTLLVGAASVFGELQNSLDRIWRAPPRRGGSGLWGLLRARLLTFGMVLGIGFLLVVSLLASAAIAALGKRYAEAFGGWAIVAEVLNLGVSIGVITLLFAMIYKILPRVRIGWRDVWVGAAVTAVLFSLGKSLIGLYLGRSGVASGFGAAGSIIVVIVWTYYSAQVFLLGAEFTHVYAHARGSRCPEAAATGDRDPDQAHDRLARSRGAIAAAMAAREHR